MVALKYKEEHNKVGYLLKPTESDYYHQIIDFLSASHIRFALTSNPIIFDSLVKQFWSTATLRAHELGPPAILATIDKTPYTITEELVRSRLQLADDGGVADLPIPEIYFGMDNLGYVTEGKLTFFKNKFSPQWRGMVSSIGNAKKFLMYPRFLQTILGIETRVTRQYKVWVFSSKLFANMRLNFAGYPIPLLLAMLLQAQSGDGVEVAEQAVPHPMPSPDHSPAPLPTPSRPQTSDPVAQVLEHDHRSDQHKTTAGSFPSRDDAPLGGDFHPSPSWSSYAPSAGQPSGAELHDHKKLFQDVVGKLVKKVETLEVKLKTKKRKMVVMVDDSDIPSRNTSHIPATSPCAPPAGPPGTSDVPPAPIPLGALAVPADSLNVPADSPNVPAGVSRKGKSPMVEEDISVKAKTFRQMEEDRLGEEAAKRLHEEEMAAIDRERAEAQRQRQQEVLESAMFYNEADWLNIRAQVEANSSLSKTLLGDDVSEDNFPARMDALIKKKRQALAEQLFKERQNRPMTPAQQKAYMRQYVKNKSSAIYNTGWTMAYRPGPVLEEPSTKRPKSLEAPTPSMPEVSISPAVISPPSSHTRRKSLGRKPMHNPKSALSTLDLDAPAQTFQKIVIDEDSDDEDWSAVIGWEVLSTPLELASPEQTATGKDISNSFMAVMICQKSLGYIVPTGRVIVPTGRYVVPAVKTASTLMDPNKELIKDAKTKDVDVHLYRSMIGSLMYLTASRPDIIFAVCACARDSPFDLEAFSDSDYAGASLDRKSITRDGKKIVITEASIRRDLRLDDAEGTTCLPNAAIFKELARMGAKTTTWNEFSSTMASAIICLANNQKLNFSKYILDNIVKNLEDGVKFYMFSRFVQVFVNHQLGDMSHHKGIFINPSLTKKVFANMKRVGTCFLGKHKSRRKQRKETKVPYTEPKTKKHIPTPSHDPLPSGEDRMQLSELMEICTKFSDKVLSLEQIKTNQAAEIEKLKKRVKKLKGKKKKRTHGLKMLYKVRLTARVESSEEEEDQMRMNDEDLFGVNDLDGDEVIVDVTTGENVEQDAIVAGKEVSAAADKVVTTAESVEGITAATTPQISKDDVTLAQTLIEIKAAKPKARGVIVKEPSESRTTSSSQPSQILHAKDKGKGIMVEPEKPLKKKYQIVFNEEVARKLDAQTKAKMEEEERIAREKDKANRSRLEKEDDTAELKRCLKIVLEDDDDVTIKATPISSKSPTIVDYKIYKEGKKSYFKIIRADRNSQNYLTFETMFKNFNKEDLEVLRSIVKKIFKKTKPVNDMDNLLFQTLKTMFEHHVEDNI
nr:hypothetical protein [Tanacetum cinerariifolium]